MKRVNEYIEEYKTAKYVYSISFVACLGSIFFWYSLTVYNPCSYSIAMANKWDTNTDLYLIYQGIITACIPFGAIFGSYYSYTALAKGRRIGLMIADLLGLVGVAFSLLQGIVFLCFGRLICGIAIGLNSVIIPIYIREMSPNKIAGSTGALNFCIGYIGIIVVFLFGFLIPDFSSLQK